MKKLFFSTSWLLFQLIGTAQSQHRVDTVFVRGLMQLAYKRIEAFDLGDTSIWSPYVANSYIIATPTGKVLTKADVMKGFGPPTPGYKDVFHFEDVHVISDSDIAVMSYKIKEHEWWGNQANDVQDLRKTDTYIRKDGQWLLFASHETFYPFARKAVNTTSKSYHGYAGQYQVMPALVYFISQENKKLFIQENSNTDKAELLPLSNNVFFCQPDTGFFNEGGVGIVAFVTDKKGKVKHISFRRYGREIKAQRVK